MRAIPASAMAKVPPLKSPVNLPQERLKIRSGFEADAVA
jgi:hypothetical protein